MCSESAEDISDGEIRPHIDRYVDRRFGSEIQIKRCRRAPVQEITTAKCDIISVELSSGATLLLFLKKYGLRIRRSVNSKASRQRNRKREVFAYQEALPLMNVGSAPYVAAALGHEEQKEWLLIEFVTGTNVAYFRKLEYWYVTAAWQAKFHKEQQSINDRSLRSRALKLDHHHFDDIANEMYDIVRDRHPKLTPEARALKDRVLTLAELLVDASLVLVHGDFTATNILIRSGRGRPSSNDVCLVDWELFGLGPHLFDLSRITHGYEPKFLERFIKSYRDEAAQLDLDALPAEKFLRELYQYRAYWWCRRVRDLVAWEKTVTEVERTLLRSEHDANYLPP